MGKGVIIALDFSNREEAMKFLDSDSLFARVSRLASRGRNHQSSISNLKSPMLIGSL